MPTVLPTATETALIRAVSTTSGFEERPYSINITQMVFPIHPFEQHRVVLFAPAGLLEDVSVVCTSSVLFAPAGEWRDIYPLNATKNSNGMVDSWSYTVKDDTDIVERLIVRGQKDGTGSQKMPRFTFSKYLTFRTLTPHP